MSSRSSDPPAFRAAFDALDAAGLRWCRLRPRGNGLEDDLLVERRETSAVVDTLAAVGFVWFRRPARGSHRAFHAYDPASGGWPKLDVVTRIDVGQYQERRTELADGFLARRRRSADGKDWVLAPDDAFWALLLHEIFDRAAPVFRHAGHLRELAQMIDPAARVAPEVHRLLPADMTPAEVVGLVAASDWPALERLGTRMRRRSGSTASVARAWRARFVRRLDRADPPFVRRGLSVALLGPDGAGKSTLGMAVGAGGPVGRRVVYLGLYGGHHGGRGRPGGWRLPGIGLAGRLMRMWRGWLVARWHVARGRLVILDRHPYDARMTREAGPRTGFGRWILGRSLPAPDLVVVLDAPAETLFARKPEHTIDRLAAQRVGYLDLARRLDGAQLVDVGAPAEDAARAVTALVWARLADRARRDGAR